MHRVATPLVSSGGAGGSAGEAAGAHPPQTIIWRPVHTVANMLRGVGHRGLQPPPIGEVVGQPLGTEVR